MKDLIAISAIVADRSYRIKIRPEDEEAVRRTLKVVNDKIIEYKTQYAGKDFQDYISMVLLWFATEQNAVQNLQIEKEDVLEQLNGIEKLLDKQLQHEN
jgi:cell division protein ZapA